jgi:hypothetical protein
MSCGAAGVAYALADAVKKGAEGKASYLLLDLGVMVHEGMSLLLMPLAAPLFRREALMYAACHGGRWNPPLIQEILLHDLRSECAHAQRAHKAHIVVIEDAGPMRSGAVCRLGPPVFLTAGSIAAYHYKAGFHKHATHCNDSDS